MTEYYKKTLGSKQYYYAKEDEDKLHVFYPSATDPTLWVYTVNVMPSESIEGLLVGATAATRTELDTPINQIQTVLTGL
jgi:hypothetical protein